MLTFPRAAAISNVPIVSILAAIIGIPRYVRLELRNVMCRNRSTYINQKIRDQLTDDNFLFDIFENRISEDKFSVIF